MGIPVTVEIIVRFERDLEDYYEFAYRDGGTRVRVQLFCRRERTSLMSVERGTGEESNVKTI